MSRICIGVLDGCAVNFQALAAELQDSLEQCDVSVSYGVSYNEPFLDYYRDKKIITLNFVDNRTCDNCEMLFLADNCSYNGTENVTPFHERMRNVATILTRILNCCPSIDLYIGDSGMQIDEFEEVSIPVHEFHRVISSLNTAVPSDLHLIISG